MVSSTMSQETDRTISDWKYSAKFFKKFKFRHSSLGKMIFHYSVFQITNFLAQKMTQRKGAKLEFEISFKIEKKNSKREFHQTIDS